MPRHQAARFLGIPDAWHQNHPLELPTRKQVFHRLTPWLDHAFEDLARHIACLPYPTDYRARRQTFARWTLRPEEWDMIRESLPRTTRRPEEQLRTCASAFIWTLVTGSEWRLAPTLRAAGPNREMAITTRSPQYWIMAQFRSPTLHFYTVLRESLTRYAGQLAAAAAGRWPSSSRQASGVTRLS
ncbi:hypothetical protein [Streptomyces sp. Je 1-369]|uniref:hypothetical protein n=1 Tax=Streptomyces sp. Je 1-369 TaxID=2966192 RepID=UPI0022855D2D|nr:hypothetical protein [Streptomyces sp. Je 1-369]WAM00562.1 hypothetical protein NOO62_01325 [Streptomyces sp. Je 1-369]